MSRTLSSSSPFTSSSSSSSFSSSSFFLLISWFLLISNLSLTRAFSHPFPSSPSSSPFGFHVNTISLSQYQINQNKNRITGKSRQNFLKITCSRDSSIIRKAENQNQNQNNNNDNNLKNFIGKGNRGYGWKNHKYNPISRDVQSRFGLLRTSFSAMTPDGDMNDFSNDEETGEDVSFPSSFTSTPPSTSSSSSPIDMQTDLIEKEDSQGNRITREVAEEVFTGLFARDSRPVILFDGICSFCNGGINLLSDLDTTKNLRFATLQSDTGKSLLVYCNREADDMSSIVVIEQSGQFHTRSDAMLTILENTYMFPPSNANEEELKKKEKEGRQLMNALEALEAAKNNRNNSNDGPLSRGLRNFLISSLVPNVGRAIPRFLRDSAYDVVSENRYRILGVKDECRIIDEDEDDRFIA